MPDYSPVIVCAEEQGSATEDYDEENGVMSAKVVLRCAYGDRHTLVADICGNKRSWPKGASGVVPVAVSASIQAAENRGTVSGQALYPLEALVTISYSTKITDSITEELEPTAEFQTLDHRWFRWGSATGDSLREEEAPGRLQRGFNYTISQVDMTPPLAASYVALIGSVNNAAFTSPRLGFQFAAETLLYAPPSISRKTNSAGVVKLDVTRKFTYNPNTWNKFFRAKTGTWDFLYLAGSATPFKPYPTANLTPVLP